jgi:hypothetical protein
METKIRYTGSGNGAYNAFAATVAEIKDHAGKAGRPLENAEIAKRLTISLNEFDTYLKTDAPIQVLQELTMAYADYTKRVFTEFSSESEQEAPDTPDPDEFEDQ